MGALPDFAFDILYSYMLSLASNDSSIIYPYDNRTVPALTVDACIQRVGANPGPYSRQDVYDRVLLWRVPLIALWATTTLPALARHTKFFTLLHLVADPIDTLWSLFYKLDLAKCTAEWSERKDKHGLFTFEDEPEDEPENAPAGINQDGNKLTRVQTKLVEWAPDMQEMDFARPGMKEYVRDAIASIIAAYDEWGYGADAYKAIYYAFNSERWPSVAHRSALRDQCARTAFYVSSDRVSRVLPSAISTLVFFIQMFAGFWKTLDNIGDTFDPTNAVSRGLNRAPHNIAFGALFFWLPLAVLLTALVGGSQTAQLMPRVLGSFRHAIITAQNNQRKHHHPLDPNTEIEKLPKILPTQSHKRWSHGGLPVWQLAKFADRRDPNHCWFHVMGLSVAFFAVAVPTGCAIAISWLTPTEGFSCRSLTQLAFLIMWICSLGVDFFIYAWLSAWGCNFSRSVQKLPALERSERAYRITFVKDSFFFIVTVLMLTGSALGMFNSCNCWSRWFPLGSTGYISFPQEDYIFRLVKRRLSTIFVYIVVLALASQVLIYGAARYYFRKGHRVLKQRDIDEILKTSDVRKPQRVPTVDDSSRNAEESYPLTSM